MIGQKCQKALLLMLIVTGYINVDPVDLAEFINTIGPLVAAARKRDGNLSYDVAVEDPVVGRLLVAERWRDQAALNAHLDAPDTMAFVNQWQDRMVGNVLKYDAVRERGLMEERPGDMTVNAPILTATRFLNTEGGRVAYDDTGGDGTLILAIPGMGDLRAEYRHLRPALTESGYRVVTMDVRGFGETTAQWDDYSARAVARDALALIAHLGASDAFILGNSFAAGSALWAAKDDPGRVKGVVLLGPVIRDLTISPTTMLAFNVGFGGPWRSEFWTAYWDNLFPTRKPADHDAYKSQLLRNMEEPARMEALWQMFALSKAETAAIVPKSTVPAMVVMGSLDPDFDDPGAEASWLAKELSGTSLIVEGAGHYPHAEMPDRVAPAVVSFIRSLTAG